MKRLFQRGLNFLRNQFFREQWFILFMHGNGYESLEWNKLKPLIPPRDRFWADPFIIERDGTYYIFLEEMLYCEKNARLICKAMNKNGEVLSTHAILEKPYHLSYPFLFEYGGELYMIPETAQNSSIELYRCARFPGEWEFVKDLMRGKYWVDATLLEYNGKWWMFVGKKVPGGSSWDSLYLYHADSPLSDSWAPHPMNPIVRDIRSARPAGHFFYHEGRLIRPSQDSSQRYGYALKFNHVTKLNETEYEETLVHGFYPDKSRKIIATHTFNCTKDMIVIDAQWKRHGFS